MSCCLMGFSQLGCAVSMPDSCGDLEPSSAYPRSQTLAMSLLGPGGAHVMEQKVIPLPRALPLTIALLEGMGLLVGLSAAHMIMDLPEMGASHFSRQ